jgi:hypothetical protein
MKKPSPTSTEKYTVVHGSGQQPFVNVKNIAKNAVMKRASTPSVVENWSDWSDTPEYPDRGFRVNVKNITSDIGVLMRVVKHELSTDHSYKNAAWFALAANQETGPFSLTPEQYLEIAGEGQLQNSCNGGKAGVSAAYNLGFYDIFGQDPTPRSTTIAMNTAYCWKHGCHFIYFPRGTQPGAPGTRQTCR